MCIGNLPEGHTAVYYPTFDYAPPYPPQKNNNRKKPWSHGLGSRRSSVFQTETSDTKYIIFSFILDFPFLFDVRISLLLFLHMKYAQITLSRREKGRQNGKVESQEELKGTPPLFPLSLLLTPLLAHACHHEHVEISLPVSRWLLRPYCHPGVHILARDIHVPIWPQTSAILRRKLQKLCKIWLTETLYLISQQLHGRKMSCCSPWPPVIFLSVKFTL